jgi:hypothetical protein
MWLPVGHPTPPASEREAGEARGAAELAAGGCSDDEDDTSVLAVSRRTPLWWWIDLWRTRAVAVTCADEPWWRITAARWLRPSRGEASSATALGACGEGRAHTIRGRERTEQRGPRRPRRRVHRRRRRRPKSALTVQLWAARWSVRLRREVGHAVLAVVAHEQRRSARTPATEPRRCGGVRLRGALLRRERGWSAAGMVRMNLDALRPGR